MTARKDLPRCKTCQNWNTVPLPESHSFYRFGFCDVLMNVTKCTFGCIRHTDYDKPTTQTETDDAIIRG